MNVFDIDSAENLYEKYIGIEIGNGVITDVDGFKITISTTAENSDDSTPWKISESNEEKLKAISKKLNINTFYTDRNIEVEFLFNRENKYSRFADFEGITFESNQDIYLSAGQVKTINYRHLNLRAPNVHLLKDKWTFKESSIQADALWFNTMHGIGPLMRVIERCSVEAKMVYLCTADSRLDVFPELFPRLKEIGIDNVEKVDSVFNIYHYLKHVDEEQGSNLITEIFPGVSMENNNMILPVSKETYKTFLKALHVNKADSISLCGRPVVQNYQGIYKKFGQRILVCIR